MEPENKPSRFKWKLRAVVGVLLLSVALSAIGIGQSTASVSTRKVRNTVAPVYPELARRMSLVATVKVQVTVAPNGAVLQAKALGGHPLLVDPSISAAKQFRYEPTGETTTGIIEFHFAPGMN